MVSGREHLGRSTLTIMQSRFYLPALYAAFSASGNRSSITVTDPPVASDIFLAFCGRNGFPFKARHTVVAGMPCEKANAFIDWFVLFKKFSMFMVMDYFTNEGFRQG